MAAITEENLALLRKLDELYMERPFFGSRRMAFELAVSRKRTQRLMRLAGIEALYPKPDTSRAAPGHKIYPYLLHGVEIDRPNQLTTGAHAWIGLSRIRSACRFAPGQHGHQVYSDRGGFLYLAAVMDWHSRFVLGWELSNTMDTGFCLAALETALAQGQPEIFNSDQGAQFTSVEFTSALLARGIAISMDGRGRCLDNVFIERLWRSVKYELVYPGDFADRSAARNHNGHLFRLLQQPEAPPASKPSPTASTPHSFNSRRPSPKCRACSTTSARSSRASSTSNWPSLLKRS